MSRDYTTHINRRTQYNFKMRAHILYEITCQHIAFTKLDGRLSPSAKILEPFRGNGAGQLRFDAVDQQSVARGVDVPSTLIGRHLLEYTSWAAISRASLSQCSGISGLNRFGEITS